MRSWTLTLLWLLPLAAQTKVDLRTQSKAVDFSGAASTQPAKKGTSVPVTCTPGEQFFKTDAAPGQNLYLCTATNAWTATGPGTVTNTQGALAAGNIVVGNGGSDAKVSGASIDGSNNISTPGSLATTGAASGAVVLNGSTSGAVTQTVAAAAGTWSFTWPTTAGSSLMFLQTDGSGRATWANPAFSQITGAVTGGQLPATAAQTNQSNTYTAGTQDFSGAAHTLPALKGTAAAKPATCSVGEEYFATDATAGQNMFYCTATNTWTQQLNSGSCPTCVTAAAPLTNLGMLAGAGSQASKVTNVTTDSGLNNLSVPGTLSTGDGSGAGEVALYEVSANGSQYFSWLGQDARATTLRAKIPAADPTDGQVMIFSAPVGGVSTITWGNSGGGSGARNYSQSFASATSVTLTHGLGTKNLIVACLDAADNSLEPASWSIQSGAPYNITVNFQGAQTGRCIVNGMGGGRFGMSFASQTTVSIAGATHNLGSADVTVVCYNASPIPQKIEPDATAVDPATNDVVITFAKPQSGRCVLM